MNIPKIKQIFPIFEYMFNLMLLFYISCTQVTFNLCPTVHEIRAWKFAYSQARKGKWEQMGRDRERFEKRISGLSRVLSPILAPEHRQKIYEQRFHSDY